MRLVIAAAFVSVVLATPALASPCGSDAVTGLYNGTAAVGDQAPIDVTLNLRCDGGVYAAQLFTSQGDFKVMEAESSDGHVRLKIDTFAALASVDLAASGQALAGSLDVAGERGTMTLARTGEALAPNAMDPRTDLTAAEWRADLRVLAHELPARHANAFFSLTRVEYDREVAALDARIAHANADEIVVGFEQIVNAIGDGHTYMAFPPDRRPLPIELTRFGGDFRITAIGKGSERALGAHVLRIGDTLTDRAFAPALTVTPRTELDVLKEGRALIYLTRGIVLHGFRITPDRNHAVFTLKDDSGREFTMDFQGAQPGETPALSSNNAPKPLAQQRPDDAFWCEHLASGRTIYCAFRAYGDLHTNAVAMFALVDRVHPDKLVIDMRDNGGGDYTVGEAELIKPIVARADLNVRGRLYVLIGPFTFSAAMNNAAQFDDMTNAILVGQTIGEKPNSYQEPRQFRLPNSHLVVRVSTLFYEFRKNGENAVRPEKEIVPTWEDVRAGRDPVLDWVLAQPTP